MGPFKVLACPARAPNTYHLDVPVTWRVFFNLKSNICAPTGPTCAGAQPARRAGRGAGGAQVPDALRPPARAGALGGPRRIRRHVGAAGAAGQLLGCPHRLRTSYRVVLAWPVVLGERCLAPRRRLPPPPHRRRHFRRQVSPFHRRRISGDLGAALVGRQVLNWQSEDGLQH
jgi:hypothetical protein